MYDFSSGTSMADFISQKLLDGVPCFQSRFTVVNLLVSLISLVSPLGVTISPSA